jgi:glutamate synthase domain-containing protein 2
VTKKGHEIANYHNNLLKGMKTLLAIMGKTHISQLSRKDLTYRTDTGEIFFNVDEYFASKLHI